MSLLTQFTESIRRGFERGLVDSDTTDIEQNLQVSREQALAVNRYAFDMYFHGLRDGVLLMLSVDAVIAGIWAIAHWWPS